MVLESQESSEPGLRADQELIDRGWLRIGAGAAVAAQAMVFSLAVNLSEISGWAYATVHGILILSALLTLFFLGRELMCSAWSSLLERRVSIDLLFLLTLGGALAGSLVSTFAGVGSVYYEVVAILIVVHTAGKMLGARSRVHALKVAEQVGEGFDKSRVVQADGSVETCPASAVEKGCRVRVLPGEAITVDGEIHSGRGYVQETSMTGEWKPVSRSAGDKLWAGTYSIDGTFDIVASGGRRRIDEILEEVRRARVAPSRLQQQADRLMAWFLPLVAGVSVATFLLWLRFGPWDRALFNAMAVLLVACPCAMGLATPIAVWGALARVTRFGLVARTADLVDVASRADTLVIDKTGTLSESVLRVREWRVAGSGFPSDEWLKAAVGCVECELLHPVAQAFVDDCHVLRDKLDHRFVLVSRGLVAGLGVVANIRDEAGKKWRVAVGERGLVAGLAGNANAKGSGTASDVFDAFESDPGSAGKFVFVFLEGKPVARVELGESWRPGLEEALADLSRLGVSVEILSGDPGAGKSLGRLAKVMSGAAPLQKKERVAELVAAGRCVLYVGDGINDAAAMSVASGAIAMRGGASLACASAMAVFAGEDLRFLPRTIELARRVRRRLRLNLYFAAGYNLAGMVLAATGQLHPVAAALLMLVSSAFVSILALRSTGPVSRAER